MISKLTLIPTKQLNMPTIQANTGEKTILLYSKYNPNRDADAFAEEVYDEDTENYLIYGLGLGYHINSLEDRINAKGNKYHIYIIECNMDIYRLAKENINLSRILNNKNTTLFLLGGNHSDNNELNKTFEIENIKIVYHKPSLNIIPEEFINLKYLFEEYEMSKSGIIEYSDILYDNFKENINNFDDNVDTLFNKYKDTPLYLIAAGPSLDKNINVLSKVKDNGIILSVGRAVRSLLAAGITPNYIIITDPSDFLYDMQLKDLNIDVPIIVLSTCDKNVILKYNGFKYIALQKGYAPAEEYAKDNKNKLVRTGGSVATTGLDIAIKMGCNPIVFVGQDLAFTDNQTHSKDTFSKEVVETFSFRNIEDIYGNIVQTHRSLYSYRRWIQNRIAEEKDIEFIDATEGGARIEGTKVVSLKECILALNRL